MPNLSEVARDLTLAEGLKDQVKIGNVRELLHVLFTKYPLHEIVFMWAKYNKIKIK